MRGFAKDVFFLSHSHRENGGAEESASKYNTFEVRFPAYQVYIQYLLFNKVNMIKDLVMYLLR